MPMASLEEINDRIGSEAGVSDWILIDQDRIDAFAEVTEDPQFIHIDPEAAAKTPFGGTIAHGFLTLSLLSRMAADAMLRPESVKMGVNYGFEKIRFLAPVRSGKRVRGRLPPPRRSARASPPAPASGSSASRKSAKANTSSSTKSPSRSTARTSLLWSPSGSGCCLSDALALCSRAGRNPESGTAGLPPSREHIHLSRNCNKSFEL